jgi:hypothetical protein
LNKPTKAQIVKRFREEILSSYTHLRYVGRSEIDGYTYMRFTTPYDDDWELTEKIASRVTDILLETGHYIPTGIHQEDEQPAESKYS